MAIIYGCLLPHPPLLNERVGKGREKEISETQKSFSYVANAIKELEPDTIVIMSPHTTTYSDYLHISPGEAAHGDFSSFGARGEKLSVTYDTEFVRELILSGTKAGIPMGTEGEENKALDHGVMIPLLPISKVYDNFKVVRLGVSGMYPITHYEMGMIIRGVSEKLGRRTVFIASGDMSHRLSHDGPYSYSKEGPVFDSWIKEIFETGDFLRLFEREESFLEKAGECGYRPIVTLAGTMDGRNVITKVLSYEGPFGVGYLSCEVIPEGENKDRNFFDMYKNKEVSRLKEVKEYEDPYIALARLSLETRLKEGRVITLKDAEHISLPSDISSKAGGVFVTLKEHGTLRGCIGTIEGQRASLGEEIIENAVSSGLRDPRFDPVTVNELPYLSYSVDILYPAERISSIDDLDPKVYGVIVSKGHRRGLLLPNIEGVDTKEEQVEIALRKGGISKSENYVLERFKVERHGES